MLAPFFHPAYFLLIWIFLFLYYSLLPHRWTQSIPSFFHFRLNSLLPLAAMVAAAVAAAGFFNHTLSFSHSLRLNCATYSSICTLNTSFNTCMYAYFSSFSSSIFGMYVCMGERESADVLGTHRHETYKRTHHKAMERESERKTRLRERTSKHTKGKFSYRRAIESV